MFIEAKTTIQNKYAVPINISYSIWKLLDTANNFYWPIHPCFPQKLTAIFINCFETMTRMLSGNFR